MPLVMTPVVTSSPGAQTTCSSLGTIAPVAPTLYGCPISTQLRSVTAIQANQKTLSWTVHDSNGNAVDLSTCGAYPDDPVTPVPGLDEEVLDEEPDEEVDYSQIRLRFRETIVNLPSYLTTHYDVTGTVTDAAAGEVSFVLPADLTQNPGVYFGEVATISSAGTIVHSEHLQFLVQRGLFGRAVVAGPPTLAEIRLHLRDSHSSENMLLNNVQYSDAEILQAIEYPVLFWNECQPPINRFYSTQTYPFRFHWLEGIVAWLYRIAAHWYRRNALPYQAGGVTINDLNKAKEYQEMADDLWARYTDWVTRKKIQFNADSCVQAPWSGRWGGFSGGWGW